MAMATLNLNLNASGDCRCPCCGRESRGVKLVFELRSGHMVSLGQNSLLLARSKFNEIRNIHRNSRITRDWNGLHSEVAVVEATEDGMFSRINKSRF